jgi:hypothetical protein
VTTATILPGRGDAKRGPAPGETLASCKAAGCTHREHAAAARAHRRTTPPVPAVGTTRRLRALVYNGFSVADLAARAGLPAGTVRWLVAAGPDAVPASMAAKVADLYDALWSLDGACARAARDARLRGFVPPLAWDDDEPGDPWYTGHGIDDPEAVPAPDWRRSEDARAAGLTDAERVAELAEAVGMGLTLNQAARRLGVSGGVLSRIRGLVAVVA